MSTASICLAIILMLIEVLLLGGDESPGVAAGLSAIAGKTVLYGIVLLLGKNNSSLDDGQTQSAI